MSHGVQMGVRQRYATKRLQSLYDLARDKYNSLNEHLNWIKDAVWLGKHDLQTMPIGEIHERTERLDKYSRMAYEPETKLALTRRQSKEARKEQSLQKIGSEEHAAAIKKSWAVVSPFAGGVEATFLGTCPCLGAFSKDLSPESLDVMRDTVIGDIVAPLLGDKSYREVLVAYCRGFELEVVANISSLSDELITEMKNALAGVRGLLGILCPTETKYLKNAVQLVTKKEVKGCPFRSRLHSLLLATTHLQKEVDELKGPARIATEANQEAYDEVMEYLKDDGCDCSPSQLKDAIAIFDKARTCMRRGYAAELHVPLEKVLHETLTELQTKAGVWMKEGFTNDNLLVLDSSVEVFKYAQMKVVGHGYNGDRCLAVVKAIQEKCNSQLLSGNIAAEVESVTPEWVETADLLEVKSFLKNASNLPVSGKTVDLDKFALQVFAASQKNLCHENVECVLEWILVMNGHDAVRIDPSNISVTSALISGIHLGAICDGDAESKANDFKNIRERASEISVGLDDMMSKVEQTKQVSMVSLPQKVIDIESTARGMIKALCEKGLKCLIAAMKVQHEASLFCIPGTA